MGLKFLNNRKLLIINSDYSQAYEIKSRRLLDYVKDKILFQPWSRKKKEEIELIIIHQTLMQT